MWISASIVIVIGVMIIIINPSHAQNSVLTTPFLWGIVPPSYGNVPLSLLSKTKPMIPLSGRFSMILDHKECLSSSLLSRMMKHLENALKSP